VNAGAIYRLYNYISDLVALAAIPTKKTGLIVDSFGIIGG
jgi:hypothetical protein